MSYFVGQDAGNTTEKAIYHIDWCNMDCSLILPLMIGTSTKGLFKYEQRALLKSYSFNAGDKNSITPGWVNNIYESKDGKIWITTSGQGLSSGINEMNPQTGYIQSWPYKAILPAVDYVSGIMEINPDELMAIIQEVHQ